MSINFNRTGYIPPKLLGDEVVTLAKKVRTTIEKVIIINNAEIVEDLTETISRYLFKHLSKRTQFDDIAIAGHLLEHDSKSATSRHFISLRMKDKVIEVTYDAVYKW